MVRNHEGETGFRGWQPRDRTGSAAMSIRGSGRSEGMPVEGSLDTRLRGAAQAARFARSNSRRKPWASEARYVGRIPGEEVGIPTRATGEHSEGEPRPEGPLVDSGSSELGATARHRRNTSKTRRVTGKVREGAGKTNDPLRRPRGRRTSHLTMIGPRQALQPGQPHESLRRDDVAQVTRAWRKVCRPSIL